MSGRGRDGDRVRARATAARPAGDGTDDGWTLRAEDAGVAVMAHALLGSMAVISGAAETLHSSWTDLSDANRKALLAMIEGQSSHVSGLLRDLIRGLPEAPIRGLELLGRADGLVD